jgi:hypothetical protein
MQQRLPASSRPNSPRWSVSARGLAGKRCRPNSVISPTSVVYRNIRLRHLCEHSEALRMVAQSRPALEQHDRLLAARERREQPSRTSAAPSRTLAKSKGIGQKVRAGARPAPSRYNRRRGVTPWSRPAAVVEPYLCLPGHSRPHSGEQAPQPLLERAFS